MASSQPQSFAVHNDAFHAVTGSDPTLELLLSNTKYAFAHEAGVFIPSRNELFITSNIFPDSTGTPTIQVSKVTLSPDRTAQSTTCEELQIDAIKMGNGGVNYRKGNDSESSILFCVQGTKDPKYPSGIYEMESTAPYATKPLITSFHGRNFNSVNDVVVHSDGSIWFTDPIYGFEQGFRPAPQLPNQVYRFDPRTGSIRAVADGFGRPNGICFSPDEKVCYITDTDWVHGDGTFDLMRPSSIYAFDVSWYSGAPFLTNRRLFAFVDVGVPDGIKCDENGNVYSGCGDGVNVWSTGGDLIGRILVPGGVANFCFGREGELFLLNENHLWRAQLSTELRGALLVV